MGGADPGTQPSGSRSSTASSGQGCVFVCPPETEGALNRLQQIEQEVLAGGREWTRALLEKRLQEECLMVEMVSAKTGEELANTRRRSMGLDTVVGKVNLKVRHGYGPEEGWVCPTRQAWGLTSLTNERLRSCESAWPAPPPWWAPTPKPKSWRPSGEHRSVTPPSISACRNSDLPPRSW